MTESLNAAGAVPDPIDARAVGLAELLSALSHALDMTEGQPAGHTMRACLIGMRLAAEVGLPADEREALYYALLLKDAGCSSNASRMAALFGASDRRAKQQMKLVDWDRPAELALQTFRTVGGGRSLRTRAANFLRIARTRDMSRDLVAIRCDRGAQIVRGIGFPDETADTVRSLDEHWNGRGYPDGLKGDDIPLLSRIALLAQGVEIYSSAKGVPAALRMVRGRRGSWFDPRLADMVCGWSNDVDWWRSLGGPGLSERVIEIEPGSVGRIVDSEGLDRIARAFAEIIDAKSPFTYRHSSRVAELARGVGKVMGFDDTAALRIYRAGLLHDIGKLGISNRILDKNGPLTPTEREEIERHPIYSADILNRVDAFRDFAGPAVLHHEKLDGSGYPWRRKGEELEQAVRILVVVDIFEALTADRPYRAGMVVDVAMEILKKDAGTRLCADSIDALEAYLKIGNRE